MTSFVQKKKKTCENDVVGNVTFVLDWFTSNQSHYYLYYNGIPRFLRKICEISLAESQIYKNCKLRQLSGRFQTLTWRPGEMVRESPRLSGRVDSTGLLDSLFL